MREKGRFRRGSSLLASLAAAVAFAAGAPGVSTASSEPTAEAGVPPSATLLPPDGTLLGTVVLEGRPSFAMFAQGDGYRTVREGEEITEGALLREVRPDRIVVERGGVRRETLLFPEGLGVALALGGGGPGKASVEWVQSLEGRAERIRARMEQSRRRFRRAVGPLDGSIPGAHGTD